MNNTFLSSEEFDFFSLPSLNSAERTENFPVRHVSPDLNEFLLLLPIRFCVVICSSVQSVRNFLTALEKQTIIAGDSLVLDRAGKFDEYWDPARLYIGKDSLFTVDGDIVPAVLDRVLAEQRDSASNVRYVYIPSSSQLLVDNLERQAEIQTPDQNAPIVFFMLIRASLHPAQLATLLTLQSVIIIDSAIYVNRRSVPEANRQDATLRSAFLLDGFVDHHRLQQKNSFVEEVLSNLETPVLAGYADGRIMGGNEAFLQLSGYSMFEIMTHNWIADLAGAEFQTLQEEVFSALLATGRKQELYTELQTSSGECMPCQVSMFLHNDDLGHPLFFSAQYHPVTTPPVEKSEATPRHLFADSLQIALKRSTRQMDYAFAVLVMGVDNIAQILLQIEDERTFFDLLAKRTSNCLRTLDIPTHLDSEHFFILLDSVTDVIGAVRVAQRIQEETGRAFRLGQSELHVTCSFGVVMAPKNYTDENDILQDARTALQRAMQRGERQIVVFDERQNSQAVQFLRIESGLRTALLENEVSLHFQPIIRLADGTIRGVEAFMRWDHKRKGLLRAEWFLPFAEHSDVVFELEAWAIRRACSSLKRFQQIMGGKFFLGLNVSLKNALRFGFLEELLEVILEHELEPESIFLEIREPWLKYFADRFSSVFAQVSKAGLGVVLDHFDATHISLVDLHRFPLRGLKLDESLQNNPAVLASLLAIANSTDLFLAAPGVEDATRLPALQEQGCAYAQGDALAPVMDETTLLEYLLKHS